MTNIYKELYTKPRTLYNSCNLTRQRKLMWNKQSILDLLESNDVAVTRAVVAIYNRQTASEQNSEETLEANGIGFNGSDARFLSYCAKYAKDRKTNLSGEHLIKARHKIKKYWKQLVDIANQPMRG
jgi:hypothetical protein